MRNYYTILGIADFAGADEVKAAHRRLSKRYHPDLNNGNKHYEEKFKEVQHAYEQLRDPEIKEMYDNRLRYVYAARNAYSEPIREQPSYTYTPPPPQEPIPEFFKWRRRRGLVVIIFIILFFLYKITYLSPWETNKMYPVEVYTADTTKTIREMLFPAPVIDTATPPRNTFTIGSERETVFRAQGKPAWITRHGGGEMWGYGNSLVIFKDGTVSSYNNIDSNLNIRD